jgi:endonuclease/exonuclease/phosphatase family metal-dependent hydrolase
MKPCIASWLVACAAMLLAACAATTPHTREQDAMASTPTGTLRVATYNTSLFDEDAGGLVARLELGNAQARKIAAVLQRVRPDIVLLNEFDYDARPSRRRPVPARYLEVAQAGGGEPLRYAYRYLAPVNTGVPSGLDLDGNGETDGIGRDRGNDAWGYGLHPGQYGMLVLSRFPIDEAAVRTFQLLRVERDARRAAADGPHRQAVPPDAVWTQLRLSSKSHWDVPIQTPSGTLHFLVSHPTPPTFDGPEDRNGARNADEIRLWREYISRQDASWLCDDAGRCGGLAADARFVIAGDLNNDPVDGDGHHDAILELLEHPRVLRMATPRSAGGEDKSREYAAAGIEKRGAPAHVTGDFGPRVGALRLDYVLPSTGFAPAGSGVFWPAPGDPDAGIADGSDHHLVWVDLR